MAGKSGRLELDGATAAIMFGVWATFALDVFSTLNSSPQTTELFARDRQDSLMHWVYVGDAVAVSGGLAWSLLSKNPWPVVATVAVVVGMHCAYTHAVKRGQSQAPPENSDRSY
jgi:hypothetical protein